MMKINVLCWTILLLIGINLVEAFCIRERNQIIYDQQQFIDMAPCPEGEQR